MTQLVKLMWVTPEAEHLITDMARVSAPKNQGNYDTAPRLIKYLIKHRHWSPFEMASMCVEINTTRDIAAQIILGNTYHLYLRPGLEVLNLLVDCINLLVGNDQF